MVNDFGASNYMTREHNVFSSFNTLCSNATVAVTLVVGSTIDASIGIAYPNTHRNLESSTYIPKFLINLFFVSKHTKSFKCSISFFPARVFQDQKTKRVISGGSENRGFYCISKKILAESFIAQISLYQWHCISGHPSLESLKLLVKV